MGLKASHTWARGWPGGLGGRGAAQLSVCGFPTILVYWVWQRVPESQAQPALALTTMWCWTQSPVYASWLGCVWFLQRIPTSLRLSLQFSMVPWKAILLLLWRSQYSTVSGRGLLSWVFEPCCLLGSVLSLLFRLNAVGGSLRFLLTHFPPSTPVWFLGAKVHRWNVRTLQSHTINFIHFVDSFFWSLSMFGLLLMRLFAGIIIIH